MRKVLFWIVLLGSVRLSAQEIIGSLQTNPVIIQHYNQHYNNIIKHHIVPQPIPNDTLPFLDDFSRPGPYPDSSKWIDKSVFINRTFAIAPPSIGVATFDGLDSTGYPYDFSASPTTVAPADYLTSRPINMPAAGGDYDSSVFFSFYYQAQGNGIYPKTDDSLVLEFYAPNSRTWNWIWSVPGYQPVFPDTGFHLVMIHIKDTAFFQTGFQFRFRNYACPCGNVDHWNIDYVYLNKSRNYNDTVFQDIAFVYNPSPLLKNYHQMPWRQFIRSELADTLSTFIRNNNTSAVNRTYTYQIDSGSTTLSPIWTPSASNLFPFDTSGYCPYKPFARPPMVDSSSIGPVFKDTAEFVWTSYFNNNSGDFDYYNDTVRYYQRFTDYYAYDDGTAEQAYFLQSEPTFDPSFCMQFKLNAVDTIRAIELFFNPVVTNATLFGFRLAVWNDKGGMPGTQIYTDTILEYPDYVQGTFNQFAVYRMRDTAFVLQPGYWYFGFTQDNSTTNENPLNIGFDVNTNSNSKTWVNVDGSWQQSDPTGPNGPVTGTVMLRPLFGVNRSLTGIQNPKKPAVNFAVYPNPASTSANLILSSSNESNPTYSMSLLDTYGNLLLTINNYKATPIDCSSLAEGVYFIRLSDQKFNSSVKRLVVIH